MVDMSDSIDDLLRQAPVVPLVQSNEPTEAIAISQALLDGGLKVLEVVLRTDAAFDCLDAVAHYFPNVAVGAGTVLSAEQARKAIDCGAKFIVSPGLDEDSVGVAQNNRMPIFPGIATATELQLAWNLGLRTVKFFPAGLAGGPKMIKALSSAFRDMSFMPTGGVNAMTLPDYLAVPAVIACGGSWLTPKDAIAAGNYDEITKIARQAMAIATKE